MKHRKLIMIPAIFIAFSVFGQTSVYPTRQVVEHHLNAGNSRNLDEIMLDYADDAILIAPDGVNKGKPAIQAAFQQLFTQDPYPVITLTREVYEGDVGYIVWTMNTGQPGALQGSDTFIIREGKIVVQTVAVLPPPAQP